MSDQHSPGPWRVERRDVLDAAGRVVARADWNVNADDGSEARWEADARLIAAAPETKRERDEAVALLSDLDSHGALACLRFQMGMRCDECPACKLTALLARLGAGG